MSDTTYSVFDGSTFVTSDARGDLVAAPQRLHGFFAEDTRFLSRWVLTLDGIRLDSLSVGDMDYFAAQFFLIPPTGSIHENPRVSVMRRRLVAESWIEEIVVMNHADDVLDIDLGVEVGTDFADLFEIKDAEARRREIHELANDRELVLWYSSGSFRRETRIATDGSCKVEPAYLVTSPAWMLLPSAAMAKDRFFGGSKVIAPDEPEAPKYWFHWFGPVSH